LSSCWAVAVSSLLPQDVLRVNVIINVERNAFLINYPFFFDIDIIKFPIYSFKRENFRKVP